MDKSIMAAASYYSRSYYFNPDYDSLPKEVKKEVRALTSAAAETARGVVTLGFTEDGHVYMDSSGIGADAGYDEINGRGAVDAAIKEKAELLNQLYLWHKIFVKNKGIV
jgi:hypothetical protein